MKKSSRLFFFSFILLVFTFSFISAGFGYDNPILLQTFSFISAGFGYDNPMLPKIIPKPDTAHINDSTDFDEKIIYIHYIQTFEDNLALNPANSEFSDETYTSFNKNHDPLYRIQGSHDGTNLGLITNVEAFIEYYTEGVINDYAYVTFYNPDFGTEYGISLRKIEAREEESIQYEGRSWDHGFPPWSYFASSNLIGKVVNYMQIKSPDNGIFYIDQIGFKITYIPTY